MSIPTPKVPRFFTDFMDSVINEGHKTIVMRARALAAESTCLELDVRLHSTNRDLKYMVGLIDEHAYFDHPKTGEALSSAVGFIELLGFPKETPKIDEFYLGPFNESQVLEIMKAADNTAAKLDCEKEIEYLTAKLNKSTQEAAEYGSDSAIHGRILLNMAAHEKSLIREERKGLFTVLEGGKPKVPKLG